MVLLATLLVSPYSCSTEDTPTSPKTSSAVKKESNLLNEQIAKIEDIGGRDKFLTKKVNEVYSGMNQALAKKDLPKFMKAYREAKKFHHQLEGLNVPMAAFYWSSFFENLNGGSFGNIATQTLSRPEILKDWPSNCPSLDYTTKQLAEELFLFDRNRRLDLGQEVD